MEKGRNLASLEVSEHQFLELMLFERNAIIRAGAGTGKTYSLVSFIIHQLAGVITAGGGEPVPPSRICAITFTDKAAAELKWRIRQRVNQLVSNPESDETLNRTCRYLNIELPTASHWEKVHREMGGIVVATFHGFCAQVLRKFPVEANVEPGFKLESELVGQSLLSDVVEEEIVERLGSGEPGCLRLLDVLPLSSVGWTSGLSALVASTLRLIREDGYLAEDLRELQITVEGATARDRTKDAVLLEALHRQKETLSGLFRAVDSERLLRGSSHDKALITELEAFLGEADALEVQIKGLDVEHLADHVDLLVRFAMPLSKKALTAGRLSKAQRAMLARLPTADETYVSRLLVGVAERLREDFLGLVGAVEARFAERKRASGVLDFSDLLLMARGVLREHRHVRRSLKRRFEVVLVDEFQDTNRVQLDLVMLLGESLDAEATFERGEKLLEKVNLGDRRLFLVGDPKQSIYNFRGADVSVFRQVERRLVEELGVARQHFLQTNRRSTADLVSFGNAWFKHVLGESKPDDPDFVVRFEDGDRMEAARAEVPDGESVELVATKTRRGRRDEALSMARWIQKYIKGEVGAQMSWRERKYSDVAVLMRRFTHLEVFQQTLEEARIPYYVVKGKGFYKSSEVSDLIHFMRLLLRPDDGLALVTVLRSPLFMISDDGLVALQSTLRADSAKSLTANLVCEVAQRPPLSMSETDVRSLKVFEGVYAELGPNAGRLGARKTLEVTIERTCFREKLAGMSRGQQRVGNVGKLLEIASTYERVGTGRVPGFVRTMGWLIAQDPREAEEQVVEEHSNAVKIMTIHQSKGLEFPVVMVPELHVMKASTMYNDPIQYDRDGGIAVGFSVATPRGDKLISTEGFEALKSIGARRRDAEERRLIYVAATRAMDLLYLSGGGRAYAPQGWRSNPNKPTHVTELQDALVRGELSGKVLERSIQTLNKIEVSDERSSIPLELEEILDEGAWREKVAQLLAPKRVNTRSTRPVVALDEISCYVRCPRRYFLRHVLNLDAQAPQGEVIVWNKDAKHDHNALAKSVMARIDLERWLRESPEQRLNALSMLFDAQDHEVSASSRAEVARVVSGYLTEQPLVSTLVDAHQEGRLARGCPYILRVERPTGGEVLIRGVLDVVIQQRDGAIHVLDYHLSERSARGIAPQRFRLRCLAAAATSLWPGEHQERRWSAEPIFLAGPSGGADTLEGGEIALGLFRQTLPELIDRLLESQRGQRWPMDDAKGEARQAHRCRSEGCGYLWHCFPSATT